MDTNIARIGAVLIEAPTQGRIALDYVDAWEHYVVLRFDNGWGLSIIRSTHSYGVEAAVLYWQHDKPDDEDYHLDQHHPLVPRGVAGWLDQDSLRELIAKVAAQNPYRHGLELAASSH